jgi:hypothetical protein
MIISTAEGKSFDTNTELTAPERHVLQKLILWEPMAPSLQEFKKKKERALRKGWNNSGPVNESVALTSIIRELERKVSIRLNERDLYE